MDFSYNVMEPDDGSLFMVTSGLSSLGYHELAVFFDPEDSPEWWAVVLHDVAEGIVTGKVKLDTKLQQSIVDGRSKALLHVFRLTAVSSRRGLPIFVDYCLGEQAENPFDKRMYYFDEERHIWESVDEMVWDMFGDKPRRGRRIVHKDGNLANNAIDNLELSHCLRRVK